MAGEARLLTLDEAGFDDEEIAEAMAWDVDSVKRLRRIYVSGRARAQAMADKVDRMGETI